MKTESHYFISSSQKGLISNENPFGGPYTGTDDSLLFAIRDLDFKVSGIVEFYLGFSIWLPKAAVIKNRTKASV